MAYAPPAVVEGQPRTALPFGLFSVLTPRSSGDPHWQNGIEWETLTCAPANGLGDPVCNPNAEVQQAAVSGAPTTGTFTLSYDGVATEPLAATATAAQVQAALTPIVPVTVSGAAGGPWTITFVGNGDRQTLVAADTFDAGDVTVTVVTPGLITQGFPKSFEGQGALADASPFAVYGSYSCGLVGHDEAYAQQRATEHLLAREEARVEQALWTGDLGNGGFAPGATPVGTALSITRGIAALEGWIAREYGSLGVIHMTREAALIAVAVEAAMIKGSGLYTALGTPIVAGAGYTGANPAGAAPAAGSTSMYATPALLGYRSEPFPGTEGAGGGFDRANNDMYSVSERTYVIGYDPCGTAVVGVTL